MASLRRQPVPMRWVLPLLAVIVPADALLDLARSAVNDLTAGVRRTSLKNELLRAADNRDEPAVLALIPQLSELNPCTEPTRGLGNPLLAAQAPLAGPWNLAFTNARDVMSRARDQPTNHSVRSYQCP